ncbi:MAG: hypothetical protein ACM3NF_05835 [Gemmatimonadota bacterium]
MGRKTHRWPGRRVTAAAAAVAASAALLAACARQAPPGTPDVRATKAFEAVFGQLPPVDAPGPVFATVAYFPSAREPGKFRPAPLFSAEPGAEERLTVRTVIRGIAGAGDFSEEIASPFPAGSDLAAFSVAGGVATVVVGGPFRADGLSAERRAAAARALALTVAQFGNAREVDVSDASGTAHFRGTADGAATADIGPPEVLGLVAVREKDDEPPSVLSALFDRPVTVEEIAFFAPGGTDPVPGKVYATGFGMAAELHPDATAVLETPGPWRVRLAVRDGKGRRTSGERSFVPRAVTHG